MTKQIIFTIAFLLTLGVFFFTINRIVKFFSLTSPAFIVRDFWRRINIMLSVAFGQTKIFRRPLIGFVHALVFWGFCIIIFGSIEMVIDGLAGTEKALKFLGPVYNVLIASGDIFATIVAISIIIFLSRRLFFHIKRFDGTEMKKRSHTDAAISLSLILLLMVSLMGMNIAYIGHQKNIGESIIGIYPFGKILISFIPVLTSSGYRLLYEVSWWSHILLIFIFANYLPYSKHFHVFMSVPNVFLSRLDPLGKIPNMDSITKEVKLMMDPGNASAPGVNSNPPGRFGIKDAEDASWKNYFDSLACTECGRCTSVCPANITGKRLSPRKVMMDLRARMKEKGPNMIKYGRDFNDNRSLLRDFISEEELWACTTCNACAKECPININQPILILDMRRYLVMEEASAPGELKGMFNNIENNGAPWQYSSDDRMQWAKDIEMRCC